MAAAAAGIKRSSGSMTSLHLMGAVLIFVVSMISLAIATEAHEPAVTDQKLQVNDSIHGKEHFVLVHGIGGGAWFFFEVVTLLKAAGYSASAIDLTANGISKVVADEVVTVVQYTQPLLDFLASIDGQVIILGHSLGGGSISFAMETYPQKISKAVFLASNMPTNGQTFFSSFPPTVFPRLIGNKDLILNFANPGSPNPTSVYANKTRLALFAFNQSPLQYVTLGQDLFTPTPYQPGTEKLNLTTSKYGSIRRFYIRTGHDHAVLPSEQDQIIHANKPERVFHLSRADHMAFLSTPIELFSALVHIASI
ncbi:unnamed protein product [Sphagnum troendelagicum]|uniref:AB hydrolase-1 domain-containing protein n=1 Tax=Sphagnum troendelagicum TaxID=128251 RepID=A0ABP0TK78_9BRYO